MKQNKVLPGVLLGGLQVFKSRAGFLSKIVISYMTELEATTRGALCRKVFLEISQNWQENTCARVSFLIKLQASDLQLY